MAVGVAPVDEADALDEGLWVGDDWLQDPKLLDNRAKETGYEPGLDVV